MANKLSRNLAEKFPEMGVGAGACGGGVWCKKSKTDAPCVQLKEGWISGNRNEVTHLPQIENATGCVGCERNKT